MRDRILRAFLVAGGVSAVAAWTGPGVCPEADPGAGLVRHDTLNVSTAVVVWYDVAPDVGVCLAGQRLINTSRIWFARMRGGVGLRARRPRGPLSPTSDRLAIVIGEVHHQVKLTESAAPDWRMIPARGHDAGVAMFEAVGSGKTAACLPPFAPHRRRTPLSGSPCPEGTIAPERPHRRGGRCAT